MDVSLFPCGKPVSLRSALAAIIIYKHSNSPNRVIFFDLAANRKKFLKKKSEFVHLDIAARTPVAYGQSPVSRLYLGMDDWVILSSTRWKLRGVITKVNKGLDRLKVRIIECRISNSEFRMIKF